VISSPPGLEAGLRETLRDLEAAAERCGAVDLARDFAALDERLRSRRLLVAVVGEHNRGKSTLVNSLIGEPWLPAGQEAPTLPPVYVQAGAQNRVELVYADGAVAESTREEMLELRAEDAAAVAYARIALRNADLHGLLLVDTPGLNDPETDRLAETVHGLLPRSDLALLVLDSTQALGASELAFIERYLTGARLHRLIVVLNRDDELDDERQRAEVRERVARLLTPLLGSAPEQLPYAARAVLRARERGDALLAELSGYPRLREILDQCAEERVHIVHETVAERARVLGLALRARLDTPIVALTATEPISPSHVEATKIELACRAVTDVGEQYSMELSAFAIELRDRLVDETADATPEDLRRYLPFYIQEQFAAFLREHEQEVPARAQEAVREAGLSEAPALNVVARPPAPGLHPYVRPDFLEDSLLLSTFLTVIGLTLHPIMSTMMMTVGPLLRMLTRGTREQDERGALLRAAQAAVMQAAGVLERQIAPAFETVCTAIRASALPPSASAPPALPEDTEGEVDRARLETLLYTLNTFSTDNKDESVSAQG
jgi:GTPase SAR1 family protein